MLLERKLCQHDVEYTLKLATSKLEELENINDKTQSNLTFQFKKHSKELTPNPLRKDGAKLDHAILNSKLHKNLATIGRVEVSERKDTTQDAMSNNAHRQESRKSDQDSEEEFNENEIPATHQLSQLQWDGQRATLRLYIQN